MERSSKPGEPWEALGPRVLGEQMLPCRGQCRDAGGWALVGLPQSGTEVPQAELADRFQRIQESHGEQ